MSETAAENQKQGRPGGNGRHGVTGTAAAVYGVLADSLRNVETLARNTFREAVRDRVLYVFVVFSLFIMLASYALGSVSVGQDVKLVKDIGLASISFFGILIAVFIGTGLIYKEIDKRTLYTILSKRVRRWEFVVGKYMGLLATVWVTMFFMSVFFLVFMLYVCAGESVRADPGFEWARYFQTVARHINGTLVKAMVAMMLELAVLTAVAIMFSAASTPILSAIFTVAVAIAGRLSYWLGILASYLRNRQHAGAADELLATLLDAVYLVLPNLHNFHLANEAVHGSRFVWNLDEWWMLLLYAPAYAALALFIGALVFSRRNL